MSNTSHSDPWHGYDKILSVGIGRRVRSFRKQRGISQAKMANLLDISPQQLQKNESGVNTFPVLRLIRLQEILKMKSLDPLLFDGTTGEYRGKREHLTTTMDVVGVSPPVAVALKLSSSKVCEDNELMYSDTLSKEEMQAIINLRLIRNKKVRDRALSLIKEIRLLSQRTSSDKQS